MANNPKITEAWSLHRQSRNDDAIRSFEAIVQQEPTNIDAYYGLGLAQRASGLQDAATESFQKALEFVESEDSLVDTVLGHDHFLIMRRMLQQRIAETAPPAKSDG